MKIRHLTYFLWVLLIIFGILYFVGIIIEDSWFSPFTDLWANIFASLIVLSVIDHIVRQSRLERIEPSKNFIRKKIAHVLVDLIFYSTPPSDWKDRLESGSDWSSYINRLLGIKRKALEEFTNILLNPDYLLEDEIRNDLSFIIRILDSYDSTRMESNIEEDIWRLCDAARLSEIVIGQSIKILKQNGLMQSEGLMFTSKKGEMTEVKILKARSNIDHIYSVYQFWLKTSIEFRDECNRRIMSTKPSS